jgi:hypothetical protein
MFRFGYRRGKGKFLETFGDAATPKEGKRRATVERVASKLSETEQLEGFAGVTERAILGDLLLSFCLDNAKHALGRTEPVQRVAPAHYMATWVDLPDRVADLRYVPEMVVAMLANQEGAYVQRNQKGDPLFAVGTGFQENVLLKAFHQGVTTEGPIHADRSADRFEEPTLVGLDQLLMVRLAQQLGKAPEKLSGGGGEHIPNRRPIAERAARRFSEDIRDFVRAYAGVAPRHAFVELLESCISLGLTTIVTSVIELLFNWAATGEICKKHEQRPPALFVDCSNGIDRRLRGLAEGSMDDFMRRIERFPVVFMALRLLDRGVRYDPDLKHLKPSDGPCAAEWLNLLGDMLCSRREEAKQLLRDSERLACRLAERLQEDYAEASEMLRNDFAQPNPVWRLADALTFLQGRVNTRQNLIAFLDSALTTGRPNGLAVKRSVTRTDATGNARKKRDVRSLVLTDSVLDYLVHLNVLRSGNKGGYRPLAFKQFVSVIAEQYGLRIDKAPPGMTISNDLLQLNRAILERRLRDLGLLVGVNDAEAMKYLVPRFNPAEDGHAVD